MSYEEEEDTCLPKVHDLCIWGGGYMHVIWGGGGYMPAKSPWPVYMYLHINVLPRCICIRICISLCTYVHVYLYLASIDKVNDLYVCMHMYTCICVCVLHTTHIHTRQVGSFECVANVLLMCV
jgi:hypothetical protein